MRLQCQTFATTLLDHVRTSHELKVMLNYNPASLEWMEGEKDTLERLKLAIKYKQKMVGNMITLTSFIFRLICFILMLLIIKSI